MIRRVPSTSLARRGSERLAEEQRPGRSEPPLLMFPPLRTRVLRELDNAGGQAAKLLAIVAPVGYGKTVLMSMLLDDLRRAGKQCLWHTLDERDASVFSIVTALEAQLNPRTTQLHPTQALFRGEEPVERRIEKLMQFLDLYPLPLTIFIDNIHCCNDDALGSLLDQLVFHSRGSVQLVLSSTRDIPFDISHAELQGLLRRIGPAELSFDAEDIVQFLGPSLCQRIGRERIDAVARRTEGWPAAVRMLQIILANAADPVAALDAFSGSDEALAHLLNRQVLSGFSDDLREFLLCVAQLHSFSLDLCREAVGNERADRHLAYLLERNVFVIPLDRNRHWYRLHGLFRDFLLREAERVLSPTRSREVLTRAAHWCEKHGQWRDAIDYALASSAADVAAPIIERIAPGFVRDHGRIPQYLQWVDTLRVQGGEVGPETEYWYVWALAFHRRYDTARQQCTALAARVQRTRGKADAEKRRDLQRRIAILQTSIDSFSDHLHEAHRGAAQWLSTAGAAQDDPFNLTAANCIEICYHASMYRFVDARRSLQAAHESAFQAGSVHVDGWVASYAALVAIYEGDYAAAYRELVPALAATRAALGEEAGICGTMALVAAKCAAEMGLVDEARQLIEAGMKTARSHGFLEAAVCGLDAALLLWDGQAGGDRNEIFGLYALREVAACYPSRLSWMLSCYLIQRLVVLGRSNEAREEAERIGFNPTASAESNAPGADIACMAALVEDTAIALLIGNAQLAPAEQAIDQALRGAKAAACHARVVALSLAAADVALRAHGQAPAVRHVTRAISVAATRAIVRPFNDHAEMLAIVVADTRPNSWGFATDHERRFFLDRCRKLSFADSALQERLVSLHDDEPQLAGKLTARELELLGYIEAGLSNQQIADRIDVALTTVKWHLQNLFAKLSVTSRSAALARAKVLGLLSR